MLPQLGRATLAELAANDDGFERRRLKMKLGYGFGAFGNRFTAAPKLHVGLSDVGRDYRLGLAARARARGDAHGARQRPGIGA